MNRALLFFVVWLVSVQARAQDEAPTYRIAGRVLNADSGAPLAGANVAILPVVNGEPQTPPPDQPPSRFPQQRGGRGGRGGFNPRGGFRSRAGNTALEAATTDNDGNFAFTGIPAGKYSLEASHRGFVTASYMEHGFYSTAIVTGPGLSSDGLLFRLSPGGLIGGAITDSSGDPVDRAQVTLYRVSDDGLGSIHSYTATNTDDTGAYEFARLTPGLYYVAATARVWYATTQHFVYFDGQNATELPSPAAPSPVNLDLVYPRTFNGNVTSSADASPLTLHGGDHLRIDLHMQAVPAVHLSFSMPNPNAAASSGGGFAPSRNLELTQSVFGETEHVESQALSAPSVRMGENGGAMVVSLSVAPGEYEVMRPGGGHSSINAATDAPLDTQPPAPATEITGQAGAAPGAKLPENLSIVLRPVSGQGGPELSAKTQEGAFRFEHVDPGAYELDAQSQGRLMAIVQAEANGAQLDGHVLQVGTQPVALAAVLAPETAILSGFARTPAAEGDEPAPGVMVVLVPQHLGDHGLYRRDQSDSDGSFSLRAVAPGSYTVVAIRDGWELEWARPDVIAHYLRLGEPVTVTIADEGVVRLAKPVQVQPR
jgi:hypothetical protein